MYELPSTVIIAHMKLLSNYPSNLDCITNKGYNIIKDVLEEQMKRINQKSWDQKGLIILGNGKVIPFYEGEDPVSLVINREDIEINTINAIFECSDPLSFCFNSFGKVLPSLSDMWELRTGFKNVSQYGYNDFTDKSMYL